MPKYDIRLANGSTVTVELAQPPTPDDIPELQQHIHTMVLQQEHQKNVTAGEEAEQQVQNVATAGNVIGGALRMGGMFAGPAGAAIAEPIAETVEQAGGGGEGVSLKTIPRAALNAGLAAIPGNWFGQPTAKTATGMFLKKAIGGATEGGLIGAGTGIASPLLEGQAPTPEGIATSTGMGALMGGAVQGLRTRSLGEILPKSADEVANAISPGDVKQVEKIKIALPHIHAQTLQKGDNFRKLGLEGFGDRAHEAGEKLWNQHMAPLLAKWGGQKIDLSGIAPAMRGDISTMTLQAEPNVAKGIQDAQTFYSQRRSLGEIQGRIKDLNKELRSAGKSTRQTRSDLLGDPHYGPKMRELDALKNTFADEMGARSGMDIKDFKRKYNAIEEVGDLADKKWYKQGAKESIARGEATPLVRTVGKSLETAGNLNLGTATRKAVGAVIPENLQTKFSMTDPNHPNNRIASALIRMGNQPHQSGLTMTPYGGAAYNPPLLNPAPTNIQGQTYNVMSPRGGPTGNINPAYPARAALPPVGGTGGPPGNIIPTSGQKITPSAIPSAPSYPVTRIQSPQERNLISQGAISDIDYRAVTPEEFGPYGERGAPVEPQQSMEEYLNMNNVSPEAQRFLGLRKSRIPKPPERPQ